MTNDRSRTHQLTDWQTLRVCTECGVKCELFAFCIVFSCWRISRSTSWQATALPFLLLEQFWQCCFRPRGFLWIQHLSLVLIIKKVWIWSRSHPNGLGQNALRLQLAHLIPCSLNPPEKTVAMQEHRNKKGKHQWIILWKSARRSDDVELIIQPSALNDVCLAGYCDCCCCLVGDWKITVWRYGFQERYVQSWSMMTSKKSRVPEVVLSWWGGIG